MSGRLGVSIGVIGLLAGGAIAWGEIPASDGTVSACVAKNAHTSWTGLLGPNVTLDRKGAMRAIDGQAGQQCAGDEQPLTLNVKGEPGATSVVVRRSDLATISAGGFLTLRAPCADGERATGGGWDRISGSTAAIVLGSYPVPSEGTPTSWEVRLHNGSATYQDVQTYVICAGS